MALSGASNVRAILSSAALQAPRWANVAATGYANAGTAILKQRGVHTDDWWRWLVGLLRQLPGMLIRCRLRPARLPTGRGHPPANMRRASCQPACPRASGWVALNMLFDTIDAPFSQGVGCTIIGWLFFNVGCWLAHAYLDREPPPEADGR